MNYTDYRLSLDIFKTFSQDTLPVKQGDTAYRICATITANGTPYRITEGCYALFTAKKPDGNFINNKCTIENNTIYYQLTPQTTAAIGVVECEIVLYDANDEQLATPHFNILVDKKAYNGEEIKSSSENEVLKSIAENAIRAEEARDEARDYATSAGNAKGEAQGYALSAQDAQKAAEGAKNVAINSAISASASAFGAETAQQGAEQAYQSAMNEVVVASYYAEEVRKHAEALSSVNNIFSNALKGSASGEVIGINDISPIEHEMGVSVRGKNLCDNVYELGSISSDNGVEYESGGTIRSKNYYPIKPNATYTVKAVDSTPKVRFRFYDKNKNYIGYIFSVVSDGNAFTFTTKENCYFLRFDIANTGENLDTKLQLELGTVATAYAPYIPDISAVKVMKLGKNLFDFEKARVDNGQRIEYLDNGIRAKGNASTSSGTNAFANGWVNFEVSKKIYLKKGTRVFVSADITWINIDNYDTKSYFGFFLYGNENAINYHKNIPTKNTLNTKQRISVTLNITESGYYYPIFTLNSCEMKIENIQVTISESIEYKPYIQPTEYTPDADGVVSGVTSLYPSTTLMTDTDGALIDATYNRDINKAFEELKNAILSLGGNV